MLPSEQRNPSAFAPMHFGTQLRGLRAPCERFASWVAPGTRITRFQLAADLGWMGLATHRVSNKVSETRSSQLISSSLSELCPAHALLHLCRGWVVTWSSGWKVAKRSKSAVFLVYSTNDRAPSSKGSIRRVYGIVAELTC